MRKALGLALALATLTVTGAAFAQNQNAQCAGQSNTGANAQDQTFCFTGEDVPGGVLGPNGQGVNVIRRLHGPSLIRMRAHFVPEMLKTVENL